MFMKLTYKKLFLISGILTHLLVTMSFAETTKNTMDPNRGTSTTTESSYTNLCYAYLTELVRSSSFPFKDWGIERKKVSILIDQDDGNKIQARLFWDSESWSTIGWVEYDIKQKKLRDISAHLDKPRQLSFDSKYENLFTQCRQTKSSNTIKTKNAPKSSSSNIKRISLPTSMHQIPILDYPLPDAYQELNINGDHPISIAAIDNEVVILFFEGDTERWYLAILEGTKVIDYLLIGKSETTEDKNGIIENHIEFSIDTHKNIHLEFSSGKNPTEMKILKKEKYTISSEKNIVRLAAPQ